MGRQLHLLGSGAAAARSVAPWIRHNPGPPTALSTEMPTVPPLSPTV